MGHSPTLASTEINRRCLKHSGSCLVGQAYGNRPPRHALLLGPVSPYEPTGPFCFYPNLQRSVPNSQVTLVIPWLPAQICERPQPVQENLYLLSMPIVANDTVTLDGAWLYCSFLVGGWETAGQECSVSSTNLPIRGKEIIQCSTLTSCTPSLHRVLLSELFTYGFVMEQQANESRAQFCQWGIWLLT